MRALRLCGVLATTTALLASTGCELVFPSNPFDPATDPARQAPVRVSGAVSVADGRAPIGAEVVVAHEGVDDVVIAVADDGSYAGDVRAGAIVVSARMLGFKSPVLPLSVSPGDSVTVDFQLVADAPTSKVRGTIAAQPPLNVSGADVALVEVAPDGDDCAATVERNSADAAGDYVFGAVRPGRYRVFAASAGGVTALSDVVEVGDNDDVTIATLDIDPIGDGVRVEVSGNVVAATADDVVDVVVAAQAGLEQLRIGLSPTFDPQQGSTGIIDFDEVTPLSLPAADGPATVFAQLLGRCGQSPVYEVPLVVDRAPALVLSASLNGIGLSAGQEPTVVLRDAAASARLQLAGLDDSGPARVVVSGDVSASLDVVASAGQFAVAADVAVPAAEGSYRVSISVVDVAGNATDAFNAVVVRDLEAPRSPIATAVAVETFGPRATLWLDPRNDCPAGAEPFSCETVLPEGPLFEIRGGVFTDFTPIAGPPFVVEVQPDVVTRFEIRAKDAAQNVSAGNAIIDVTRPSVRERFRLPADRQFGMPVLGASIAEELRRNPGRPINVPPVPRAVLDEPTAPPLTVTAGTAFFSVRPTPGIKHTVAYSVLLAQPADLPSVGLLPSISNFAPGIRRLSYDPTTQSVTRTYNRLAGGFGGSDGTLTWLESTVDDFSGNFARHQTLSLDGDARFDLAGADRVFRSNNLDDEGEATVTRIFGLTSDLLPHNDLCLVAGSVRCTRDVFRWRGLLDSAAPSTSGMRGSRVAVPGLSFFDISHTAGIDVDTLGEVRSQPGDGIGVRVFGASLTRGDIGNLPNVNIVEIDIDVPAGTPLRAAVYSRSNNPPSFEHEVGDARIEAEVPTWSATGSGTERISMPDFPFSAARNQQFLLGIIIPADVEFSFPVVDPSILPTTLPEFDVAPGGTFNVVVPTLAEAGRLPLDVPIDTTAFPVLRVQRPRTDIAGAPVVAGLVVSDLGKNRSPDPLGVRNADFAARAADMAEERHVVIPVAAPGLQSAVTAAADDLVTPAETESCVAIVRPSRDTPLVNVTIDGEGFLDDLIVRVFRSIDKRDTGIFARDQADFEFALNFSPEVERNCADEILVSRIDETQSVTASPLEVISVEETAVATIPADVDIDIDYNVESGQEALIATLPVTPGTQLELVTTEDDASDGDADLRILFNDPDEREFFSEADGDEDRLILVPEGATEVQVFLTAFEFSSFPTDSFGVLSVKVMGPLLQVDRIAIPAGAERVSILMFGSEGGFIGARTRFDAEPSDTEFDCGNTETRFCSVEVPPGASEIFIAAELFAFETRVGESVIAELTFDANFADIEVGRFNVGPDDNARVTATGGVSGGPTIQVRFEDADGNVVASCSDSGDLQECVRPSNRPTIASMVVTVERGDEDATLDVRSEVFQPGCRRAVAVRDDFSDPGVLRAGEVYALQVTGGLAWPSSRPSIAVGAPVDDDAAADLRIVGTTFSPRTISSTQIAIPLIDPNAARCRLAINLQKRVSVSQSAVGVDVAAAVLVDNGVASIAVAKLTDDKPALDVVYDVAAGDVVAALVVDADDRLRFVEALSQDELRISARSGDVATNDLCVSLNEPFIVSAASFVDGGGAVVVGGTSTVGPVVRRYRFGGDACDPPILELERVLTSAPRAIAGEGDDIFFIAGSDAANNGGALFHISTAPFELVAPAGLREVVGTVAVPTASGEESEEVVIAFAPRLGASGALVVYNTTTGLTESLSEGSASFQPVVVNTDDGAVVVTVDVEARAGARASVVARDVRGNGVAVIATEDVNAAPTFDPINGRRFARDPILSASGDALAVLGFANNGDRTLEVLTLLGPSEVARRSLGETLPPGPQSLEIVGDIVIVGFEGGPRAYLIEDDALVELRVDADECVIGAAGGTLLVGKFPGDVFQAQPPTTMNIVRRDPRQIDDDVSLGETLPASLFGRAFARVIDDGDRVGLLDLSATPPVVWAMRPNTPALPIDGALRPLASSSLRLGRSAYASGLAIRETAGGAALYRLRR